MRCAPGYRHNDITGLIIGKPNNLLKETERFGSSYLYKWNNITILESLQSNRVEARNQRSALLYQR